MKCLHCNEGIARKKYCSKKCVQQAWYLRTTPSHAFGNNDSLFWTSETGKGFKWELEGAELLTATHLPFNGEAADLDWNGKRVDVKSCELYQRKKKRGKPVKREQGGVWVFHRHKPKPMDFFLCFCLVSGKPTKILLIPDKEFPLGGITIGWKSKYDIHIIPSSGDKVLDQHDQSTHS